MKLIGTILQKMSSISTPQRKFLITLLITIQRLRGKMTFRNLSRAADLHEKTYSPHFDNYRAIIPADSRVRRYNYCSCKVSLTGM